MEYGTGGFPLHDRICVTQIQISRIFKFSRRASVINLIYESKTEKESVT